MTATAPPTASGRELLRQGDYVRFWLARFCSGIGSQIQSVTIGWQIYGLGRVSLHQDVRHAAFLVGIVGLASFAPLFLLALPAGATADQHDRKGIMIACLIAECVVVGALALATGLGRAACRSESVAAAPTR